MWDLIEKLIPFFPDFEIPKYEEMALAFLAMAGIEIELLCDDLWSQGVFPNERENELISLYREIEKVRDEYLRNLG